MKKSRRIVKKMSKKSLINKRLFGILSQTVIYVNMR